MGRYLELLRASRASPEREPSARRRKDGAPRERPASERREHEGPSVVPVPSANASRLQSAGYRPKESFFGRIIWERPDTGFYVSEEMALWLLDKWNICGKTGADGGG